VTSFIDAAEYYGNNIRRTKIQEQVDFFLAFKELLLGTLQYVNANFKLGLNWNPNGDAFSAHFGKSAPVPQAAAEAKVASKSSQPKEEAKVEVKKESKLEPRKYERGISWIFDRFSNRKDLELEEQECGMKKGVMIENSDNCVYQIKGKVKTVLISNCKSVGVIVQDVVSSVDVVNCAKIQIQAVGKVPSVQIDKTDGCEIYLMTAGTYDDLLIATAKSQDMTITFPDPKNPEDYKMEAIPHQFVHRLQSGKVVSEVSELYR
jgi:adenylyl cyclase-associated protein